MYGKNKFFGDGGGSPSPAPEIRLLRRLLSFGRAVFGGAEPLDNKEQSRLPD